MELHMIYKKPVFLSTVIKNKSKHETGTDDKPRTPTQHKKWSSVSQVTNTDTWYRKSSLLMK